MEFPDLKIEPIAKFLHQLANGDGQMTGGVNVEVWFIIIGLFMISFTWRNFGKKFGATMEATTQRIKDLDRTTEENTDAQIETARELKVIKRQISRLTVEVKGKSLKVVERMDYDLD